MTVDEALTLVDLALAPKGITDLQELIFRHTWSGLSYTEIAQNSGYEIIYIREVGSKLWQQLSKAFGEKVTKTNVRSVLRRQTKYQAHRVELSDENLPEGVIGNQYQDWG